VVLKVYIVRHGETAENRAMIMQGQRDTALNAAGLEQAQLTANALEHVPFVAGYSSDLSRASQTAQAILSKHAGVALQQYPALRERYMGDMEGQHIGAWQGAVPANMEKSVAFSARAAAWWDEVILGHVNSILAQSKDAAQDQDEADAEPANVLVVSHGGLMHVLLQDLIDNRKVKTAKNVRIGRFRFPNASVSVIEMGRNKKGTLVLFADTTHLNVELVDGNADI
ncbi:phosphoglycerate mutase-like protein, partial [Trametopsis cervina]